MNEGPSDPRIVWTIVIVMGLVILLNIVSMSLRHMIFQPVQAWKAIRGTTHAATDLAGMRFTGRLMLGPRTVGGHLCVPAALSTTPAGELVFVSHIMTPVAPEVGTYQKSLGDWVSVVQPGSVTRLETGLQYAGVNVYPALRLNYVDMSLPTPKRLTSIVAFPTEEQRDLACEVITQSDRDRAPA